MTGFSNELRSLEFLSHTLDWVSQGMQNISLLFNLSVVSKHLNIGLGASFENLRLSSVVAIEFT